LHADIDQISPIQREMAIAIPVHYAIGITLALLYSLACSVLGLRASNPITPLLGFVLCTNLLPWLPMFPAMGYGRFDTHGPTGTRLFFSTLVTRSFYGVGLWLDVSPVG